jgi:hypothetical protein
MGGKRPVDVAERRRCAGVSIPRRLCWGTESPHDANSFSKAFGLLRSTASKPSVCGARDGWRRWAGRPAGPRRRRRVRAMLRAEAMVAAEIAAAPCRRETRTRGRPRAAQPKCEATGTAAGRVAKLATAETTTLMINAAKPMLMSSALAGRNGNRLTNVLWGVNVT